MASLLTLQVRERAVQLRQSIVEVVNALHINPHLLHWDAVLKKYSTVNLQVRPDLGAWAVSARRGTPGFQMYALCVIWTIMMACHTGAVRLCVCTVVMVASPHGFAITHSGSHVEI